MPVIKGKMRILIAIHNIVWSRSWGQVTDIADEITTMLDAVTQVQIWKSLLNIAKKNSIGVLVVSHDKKLLNRICDSIVFLSEIMDED